MRHSFTSFRALKICSTSTCRRMLLHGWLITALLCSAAWAQNDDFGGGGFGGDHAKEETPTTSELGSTQDITREIEALRRSHQQSAALREAPAKAAPNAVPVDTVPAPIAAMRKKLAKKASFDFDETTLVEFVELLKERLAVNVILDSPALDDEGIDPDDELITFTATKMSHAAALKHILRQRNLSYTIGDNLLTITSREKADETLRLRVYPVWDLVTLPGDETPDYDSLIDCLATTVTPNSWDEVGGPASVTSFKGMLCISQTDEIHLEIVQFLTALRQFRMLGSTTAKEQPQGGTKMLKAVTADDRINATQLNEWMSQPTEFDLDDEQLSHVIDLMHVDSEMNFLFDKLSLAEESIEPESETVRLKVKNIPRGKALKLLLDPLNLTWVIENEAVVITTKDRAEKTLITKVYDCTDLIDVTDPKAIVSIDKEFDELTYSIAATVSPHSWDDVGGPGAMSTYSSRGALIVSNTERAHRGVTRHLQLLMDGRRGSNAKPKQIENPAEIVIKAYPLTKAYQYPARKTEVRTMLINLLKDTDNADGKGGFSMDTLGVNLIISHRRDVHEHLASLLSKLGVIDGNGECEECDVPMMQGMMGGGGIGGGGMEGGAMSGGGGMF